MFFMKLLVFILKSTEFYYISFVDNIFFYERNQLNESTVILGAVYLLFFYRSIVVSTATAVVLKLLCKDTFCT